jgi:HlyD family secretion protein
MFVMNNAAAASQAAASDQTVYKETKVQRGDITVGVTESGTATINTNSVICELDNAVVDEVYVKAGQSVSQGDAVAKLTEDSVSTAVETYKLAMDTAQIKLAQAQAAQTTGKVNAKSTYDG